MHRRRRKETLVNILKDKPQTHVYESNIPINPSIDLPHYCNTYYPYLNQLIYAGNITLDRGNRYSWNQVCSLTCCANSCAWYVYDHTMYQSSIPAWPPKCAEEEKRTYLQRI